jgi:hypothetical protein
MRPGGHRDVARDHPHARLSTTEYSSTLPAMIEVDISMRYSTRSSASIHEQVGRRALMAQPSKLADHDLEASVT